jgi:glycosyltransferase involved in cell wall biosynthesis
MTSNKKLLYIGESHGVHDARFLAVLNLKFFVTSYFYNDASLDPASLQASYDLVIVSPMSKHLLELSADIDAIKIGICWAVEVNEASYEQSEIEQINEILSDFSMIIFDADYVSYLFEDQFSFLGKMHKVYFGCNVDQFTQIAENRDYSRLKHICVTRSWTPLYRNELILDALSEMNNSQDFRITFAALPPPNRSQIEVNMAQNGINVNFTGALEWKDIALLYSDNDIYISAARSDGISVSLLEAMAAGMICIVTNFPSNLEIIQSGVNGFTFTNGDIQSLSETIQRVVSLSPMERKGIGRAARKFVAERANWNINKMLMLDEILGLVDVV